MGERKEATVVVCHYRRANGDDDGARLSFSLCVVLFLGISFFLSLAGDAIHGLYISLFSVVLCGYAYEYTEYSPMLSPYMYSGHIYINIYTPTSTINTTLYILWHSTTVTLPLVSFLHLAVWAVGCLAFCSNAWTTTGYYWTATGLLPDYYSTTAHTIGCHMTLTTTTGYYSLPRIPRNAKSTWALVASLAASRVTPFYLPALGLLWYKLACNRIGEGWVLYRLSINRARARDPAHPHPIHPAHHAHPPAQHSTAQHSTAQHAALQRKNSYCTT